MNLRAAGQLAPLLWFLATPGCASDGTGVQPPPVATGAIATLEIDPGVAAVDLGASVQLTARARNSAGVLLTGRAISWSAANPGVASWGVSAFGELGDGQPIRPTAPAVFAPPLPVVGGLAFEAISVGAMHACGLTTTRSVYCWGS